MKEGTRQSEAEIRQSETGQSEAEQSKARQLEAKHSEAGESEAKGLKIGQSKVEQLEIEKTAILSKNLGLKFNKERENKLRSAYGNGSRAITNRKKGATRKLKKQALATYNLEGLWKWGTELSILLQSCSQRESDQSLESLPSDIVSSLNLLSEISQDLAPLLLEQQTLANQRTEALNDLNRLLKLITEQKKKYGYKLSPHGNFYQRHVMVQQFL